MGATAFKLGWPIQVRVTELERRGREKERHRKEMEGGIEG